MYDPPVYNNHNKLSNDIDKNFPRVNEKYYNLFIPHLTRVWKCFEKYIRINVKLKPSRYCHYKYGT